MSTDHRPRAAPRTSRPRALTVVAAGGWVLAASGLVLPWTDNRMSEGRWLLELAERHPVVVAIYVQALLVLYAAAVLAALPAHPVLPATLAGAAVVLMVVLAVATPLPTTTFTAFDGSGRQLGGSVASTLSYGPAAAGLGALGVLVAVLGLARQRRRL